VFFALWPDEALQQRLHDWAAAAQLRTRGRLTRAATIHLTLAFLGEIEPARLANALRAAQTVAATPFFLTIDTARYWRHNRIVWAGTDTPPAVLLELVTQLHRALQVAGFQLERRPFQAHVTLIRNAQTAPALPLLPPLAWPVREFVLVESQLNAIGARYTVIERFALSGAVSADAHRHAEAGDQTAALARQEIEPPAVHARDPIDDRKPQA
jgi:2'-5' RNA ligase